VGGGVGDAYMLLLAIPRERGVFFLLLVVLHSYTSALVIGFLNKKLYAYYFARVCFGLAGWRLASPHT
jgi:hypothetical protein